MNLDKTILKKLELLLDELLSDKEDYEIKDYIIDQTIRRSKKLQKLLKTIFKDIKVFDLDQIEPLDTNYFVKQFLKRYIYLKDFESFEYSDESFKYYSSLKLYYDEIKDIPVLTDEEEYNLFTEYQKTLSKEAFNKILTSNLRYVPYIAKKYMTKKYNNNKLDYMDLIQEGNLGLMIAIDKFDINKGYKFTVYAKYWIVKNILNSIIEKGNIIRIPNQWKYQLDKIKEYDEYLSDDEIANILGLDVECIKKYRQYELPLISLNDKNTEATSKKIVDEGISTEELVEQHDLREIIKQMLFELDDELLKEILISRFELNGEKVKTLETIGIEKGFTRQRIKQIEQRALNEIKNVKSLKKVKNYIMGE